MTDIAIGRWAPRFGTAATLLLSVCWGLVHPAHAQPPSREVCDKLMSDTLEEIRIASPRVSNAIKVLQDSHCEGSRAACTQAAEYLRVQTEANQPDKVANVRLAQRAQSCMP
jgi:hypothetical protein